MAAKRSVSIRVLGQEYRIRTDVDPAELQRVAALVDETMGRLRDLIAERSQRRDPGLDPGRARDLAERVEVALRDPGSIPAV